MVMPGALTGSIAPYSGRTCVCGFSPQCAPYPWFTRSNIGGRFGGELKRAGYDAVIIEGASEAPVYLVIENGRAEIRDARKLWGMDVADAEKAVREELGGKKFRTAAIGPAGENIVKFAAVEKGKDAFADRNGGGGRMG